MYVPAVETPRDIVERKPASNSIALKDPIQQDDGCMDSDESKVSSMEPKFSFVAESDEILGKFQHFLDLGDTLGEASVILADLRETFEVLLLLLANLKEAFEEVLSLPSEPEEMVMESVLLASFEPTFTVLKIEK